MKMEKHTTFHNDQTEAKADSSEELSNFLSERELEATDALSTDSTEFLNDAPVKLQNTSDTKVSDGPKKSSVPLSYATNEKLDEATGKSKRKRYKLKCKNCTCENCPLKQYHKKKKDGKLEELVGSVCKCKPKCACNDCEYIKRLRELLCNTVCGGETKPETVTPEPVTETPKPETGTPEPVIDTPKPETGTPKPETEPSKPEIETPKPVEDNPKPETGTPETDPTKPGTDTSKPEKDPSPETSTGTCPPCCCPPVITKPEKCKCVCSTGGIVPKSSQNDGFVRKSKKNKARKKIQFDNVQQLQNVNDEESKSKDLPNQIYNVQYVPIIMSSYSHTPQEDCCTLSSEENFESSTSKEKEVGCPIKQEIDCLKEPEIVCPKEPALSCPKEEVMCPKEPEVVCPKEPEVGCPKEPVESGPTEPEGSKENPMCKKCSCKVCPLKENKKPGEDKDPLSVMKCDCSPKCTCQNCAYIKCLRALLKKCDLILKLKQKNEESSSNSQKLVAKECLKSAESEIEEKVQETPVHLKDENIPKATLAEYVSAQEETPKVTNAEYEHWVKNNMEARIIEHVDSSSCFENENKLNLTDEEKITVAELERQPEKIINTNPKKESTAKKSGEGYVCPAEKPIDPCGKKNDGNSTPTKDINPEDLICKCGKICPCENCKTLKRLKFSLKMNTEPQVYSVVNSDDKLPKKCECMGKCKGPKLKDSFLKIRKIKGKKSCDTPVVQCICETTCKCEKCQFNKQTQSNTKSADRKSSSCCIPNKTKSPQNVTTDEKLPCVAPQNKSASQPRKKCKRCQSKFCTSFKKKKKPACASKEDTLLTPSQIPEEEITTTFYITQEEINSPYILPSKELESPEEETMQSSTISETKIPSQEEIKLPKCTRQEHRLTKNEFEETKQTSLCTQFSNKITNKSSKVICSCLNENCDCKKLKNPSKNSECKCTDSSKDLAISPKCNCLGTCKCVQCKHRPKNSIKCDCVDSCKCTNCESNTVKRAQCNCVDPCKCIDCKFNPEKVETLSTETELKNKKNPKKCKCIGTCSCQDKCTLCGGCNNELPSVNLETPNQILKSGKITEKGSFPCNTKTCTCKNGQCLADSCPTKKKTEEKPKTECKCISGECKADSCPTKNKPEEKPETGCKCIKGECKADTCPTKNKEDKPKIECKCATDESITDPSPTKPKEIECKCIGICKCDPCCKLCDKIVETEKVQCKCIDVCKCKVCLFKASESIDGGNKCNIKLCKCKCGECLKDSCPTKTTGPSTEIKPPKPAEVEEKTCICVQPETIVKPPIEPSKPPPDPTELIENTCICCNCKESSESVVKLSTGKPPQTYVEVKKKASLEHEVKPEITPTESIEIEVVRLFEIETNELELEEEAYKSYRNKTDERGMKAKLTKRETTPEITKPEDKSCICCNCKSSESVIKPPTSKIPTKICKCKDFECLPTDFKLKHPIPTEGTFDVKRCCCKKKPKPKCFCKKKSPPSETTKPGSEVKPPQPEVKPPDDLKECDISICKCICNECLKNGCQTATTKPETEVKPPEDSKQCNKSVCKCICNECLKESCPTTKPKPEVKPPNDLKQCNISVCKCICNECLKESCPTTKPGSEVKPSDDPKQCNISVCKCICNECKGKDCPTATSKPETEVKPPEPEVKPTDESKQCNISVCKCICNECKGKDCPTATSKPEPEVKPPEPEVKPTDESNQCNKSVCKCICNECLKENCPTTKPEPEVKPTDESNQCNKSVCKCICNECLKESCPTTKPEPEVKPPNDSKQCNISKCKCICNECLKESCPTTKPGSEVKPSDDLKQCNISVCKCICNECTRKGCPTATSKPEPEVKQPEPEVKPTDESNQCNKSVCKCICNECLKESCPITKPKPEVKPPEPETKPTDESNQCNKSVCKCICNECLKESCPTKTTKPTDEDGSTKEDNKEPVKENEKDSTKEEEKEPIKVKCKCTDFECLPQDFKLKYPIKDKTDLSKPKPNKESPKKCSCKSEKKPKPENKNYICKCKDFECLPEDFKLKFPIKEQSVKPEIKEPSICDCKSKKKKCKCKKFECLPEDVKEKIRQKYGLSNKKPSDDKPSKTCKCNDFKCLPDVKSEKSMGECQCSNRECLSEDCPSKKMSVPELELEKIEPKFDITSTITLKSSEEVVGQSQTETAQLETIEKPGPCSGPECKCESCKDIESIDSKT